MRKSFFLSILAVGALVAGCAKSEVVDTKFNEEIGFETYLGRDAQTRAEITKLTDLSAVGVYGFYTGTKEYDAANSKANLWENLELTKGETAWTYDVNQVKYWTNASDLYTFLAYAPYSDATEGEIVVSTTNQANPVITYTCPVTEGVLDTNVDLLYANTPAINGVNGHVNMVKADKVNLKFYHALSRLNVTAKAKVNPMGIQFDVKKVTLSGKFNTQGTLALATAKAGDDTTPDLGWTPVTPANDTKYIFHNEPEAAEIGEDGLAADALTTDLTDYASGDYLMMIPTDFSTTAAKLEVVYTTIYAGQESNPVTKEIEIKTNFRMGKAYSINLEFNPVLDEIEFNVTEVQGWGEEVTVNSADADRGNNPEEYPAL